jgi:hypothetical protein
MTRPISHSQERNAPVKASDEAAAGEVVVGDVVGDAPPEVPALDVVAAGPVTTAEVATT